MLGNWRVPVDLDLEIAVGSVESQVAIDGEVFRAIHARGEDAAEVVVRTGVSEGHGTIDCSRSTEDAAGIDGEGAACQRGSVDIQRAAVGVDGGGRGIGVDSGQDHGSTSTFGDAAVGNDGLDIQFREGRARFPDIERADRAAEVEVAGDGGRGGGSRRSCFADDEKSASRHGQRATAARRDVATGVGTHFQKDVSVDTVAHAVEVQKPRTRHRHNHIPNLVAAGGRLVTNHIGVVAAHCVANDQIQGQGDGGPGLVQFDGAFVDVEASPGGRDGVGNGSGQFERAGAGLGDVQVVTKGENSRSPDVQRRTRSHVNGGVRGTNGDVAGKDIVPGNIAQPPGAERDGSYCGGRSEGIKNPAAAQGQGLVDRDAGAACDLGAFGGSRDRAGQYNRAVGRGDLGLIGPGQGILEEDGVGGNGVSA